MNITQIEEIVKNLASDIIANQVNKDEFIYQLMAAYGHRKTTIGRIKSGERNLAKVEGEVRAKRHIYFKQSQNDCVLLDIDNMKKEPSVTRDKIRFVIATDFSQFVALDTRTHDTLDIEFTELGKHFDFFLPWAGMEKAVYQGENPADVKAAEKMAKLFDLIKADNFNEESKDDTNALHNLNVFLTRLLFCFFAEDTGIFTRNQFSENLESKTKADGSDVDGYLNRLFEVLNTNKEDRGELPDYLAQYEYVNGGLFANTIASPRFSTKSRKMLIECGSELDWSDINPDIFGSMIQAVVHPDQRGGMGMHYTSVTNIMKVIEPLFLDELYAEFENIEDNIDAKLKPSRLRKLHDRIAEIKLFDPACGSGNFLIIAFKELRKLEMEIIKRLQELDQNDNQDDLFGDVGLDSSFSRIKLSQFYGIELDDFAHEVAILSLWLAEHQMNVEFQTEFGECEPSLPLKQSGNIYCGNATRLEWSEICPASTNEEVFILGNPPYLGYSERNKEQKEDMDLVFEKLGNVKRLDYIGCWLKKASDFIETCCGSYSFVSTKSICQGEQTSLIWPYIFSLNQEITFAHKPFDWSNNAKNKAGVTCIIIGVAKRNNKVKYLYDNKSVRGVNSINAYLIEGSQVIISQTKQSISKLPEMALGSSGIDGGHLILTEQEREDFIRDDSKAEDFIKPFIGGADFLRGTKRYCIWIDDNKIDQAREIQNINTRIDKCREFRSNAGRDAKKAASVPHRFFYRKYKDTNSVVLPMTSSGRRKYLPVGFVNAGVVASNGVFVVYDADLLLFGILSSRLHSIWMEVTSARMRNDFRYSVNLTYNTFPIPELNEAQKNRIMESALSIIEIREEFSHLNLSQLYDPVKMPEKLREAHIVHDKSVEAIFDYEFKSEEQKLSFLFSEYKKMTGGQNA